MAVDGCGLVSKYIIIGFDCIFAVLGLALSFLGLWLRFSTYSRSFFEIEDLNSSAFVIIVTVMIVLGAWILIVVTFGDFGTCSENRSALQVFSCLVAIFAGADIVSGVLVFKFPDDVAARLVEFYITVYGMFKFTGDPVMGWVLVHVHKWLHCCGLTGFKLEDITDNTCPDAEHLLENLKISSCPSKIASDFNTNAFAVLGVFVGTGALLIIVFICGLTLTRAIRVAAASPQYIILSPITPCANPQPPLPAFPNSGPVQDQEPVVFTPLTAANIPIEQASLC